MSDGGDAVGVPTGILRFRAAFFIALAVDFSVAGRAAVGTADRLLPWPRAAARWQAELPHADWIELEGVGHAPQLEAPLETAQLIRDVAA